MLWLEMATVWTLVLGSVLAFASAASRADESAPAPNQGWPADADDAPGQEATGPTAADENLWIRCSCERCSVHTAALIVGDGPEGCCRNCGSDLVPITTPNGEWVGASRGLPRQRPWPTRRATAEDLEQRGLSLR